MWERGSFFISSKECFARRRRRLKMLARRRRRLAPHPSSAWTLRLAPMMSFRGWRVSINHPRKRRRRPRVFHHPGGPHPLRPGKAGGEEGGDRR